MIKKFTNTDYNIEDNVYYDLYNYYKDGGKYGKDAPYHKYTCTWDNGSTTTFSRLEGELLSTGVKRVMGWMIPFYKVWNEYLVEFKYYGHHVKIYAPSKTAIRDAFGSHKIVGKIIEL